LSQGNNFTAAPGLSFKIDRIVRCKKYSDTGK
jgi:hypothetical protein